MAGEGDAAGLAEQPAQRARRDQQAGPATRRRAEARASAGRRCQTSQAMIGGISRQWLKVELDHQIAAMSAASRAKSSRIAAAARPARRDARATPSARRPLGRRWRARSCRLPVRGEAEHGGERREPRVPAIARLHLPAGGRADRGGARRARRAGARTASAWSAASSATIRSRPGTASMPSKAAGEATTGRRHRHRLQHLVLDAAGELQRRDDDDGGGEPGPHVGDVAGDDHAVRPASARTAAGGLRPTMAKRAAAVADRRQHVARRSASRPRHWAR